MQGLQYWNQPVVLSLFAAEIVLSAIIIILSTVTATSAFDWTGSILYGLPLGILVLISSIVHLIVIWRSTAILGAVVLVNFIWTVDFLAVTVLYGIDAFESTYLVSALPTASFVFSLLAFLLSLVILIVSAVAFHRYHRDINSLLIAFKKGEFPMAGHGPQNA